jgi:hypothetical protein
LREHLLQVDLALLAENFVVVHVAEFLKEVLVTNRVEDFMKKDNLGCPLCLILAQFPKLFKFLGD